MSFDIDPQEEIDAEMHAAFAAKDRRIAILTEALERIAEPVNAHCGCNFPCRCDTEAAEAINAGAMRDIASEALAKVGQPA